MCVCVCVCVRERERPVTLLTCTVFSISNVFKAAEIERRIRHTNQYKGEHSQQSCPLWRAEQCTIYGPSDNNRRFHRKFWISLGIRTVADNVTVKEMTSLTKQFIDFRSCWTVYMGLPFKIKVFWEVFQRWSQLPILYSVGHRWTKHWWNDSDTGKPKCSEKNLSQCQFVYYRFPIDWPESEPEPRWWEAGD